MGSFSPCGGRLEGRIPSPKGEDSGLSGRSWLLIIIKILSKEWCRAPEEVNERWLQIYICTVEEESSAEGRGPLILVCLVAFGQGTFKVMMN